MSARELMLFGEPEPEAPLGLWKKVHREIERK